MSESFLIDINPEMELPEYKLTLHKLNEEQLASLKNITNLNISPLFVGIDNLTFDVPLHIMDSDGTNRRNKIYDLVEGDHLVKLNDMSYFIITNVKELADDNGRKYKEVHCKSREYSLIDKKLIDYKADSRVLYSNSDAIDDDGLEVGVLNYIFKYLTRSWTLDYIDPDLILRQGKGIYRALNFDNSNLIQVFVELQKTFNCIFTFDSVDKKVSVYDIKNMMGQDRGLRISDTNFIKSITKDVNSEGIITRLYLRGKDGVSIQSISPTGQPYLDNFDYYKNTKYMSQGLIDALSKYDTKVGQYNPDFKPLFVRLDNANTVMEGLLNADGVELMDKGLIALNVKLNQIQTLIDVKVEELGLIQKAINSAESVDLSGLHETKRGIQTAMDAFITERTVINGYIKIKDSEIVAQQLVIDGINSEIEDLQRNLDTSNVDNFTAEQLLELDEFIKVETFNDTNYTEYNLEELKEEGIRQLGRISQPPIQFDVDVVDFLSIVECQHVWKKFKLGDAVTLEHKEMGFKFVVRLVGYEHDVDSHSLNLKFSNTNSYDDATLYERDLMEYIGNVGTTVDFNTDKWNDVGNVESRIAKLVDSKLEEARQNILNAVGQQHLFGDDGLWLYKENPDGTIHDEQIRAINNTIALTDDNWATPPGVAITPKGIVAEHVYGKLGEFATVYANQIEVTADSNPEVDYNIIDYITEQTDEFDIAMGELDDVFSNAFSDNSITNIEANSLKIAFDNVKKEAMDIIAIANTLGLTTVVEKTNCYQALTNLQSEMNQWINQASYPITVTKSDRDNVSSKFIELKSTMVLLLDRIEVKRTDDLDGKLERTKAEFKVTTDGITSRVESISGTVESVTPHQIILSNENQSIITDINGKTTQGIVISSSVDTFKGTRRVGAIINSVVLKNASGTTISGGTITKTSPSTSSGGNVVWTIPTNTNLSSDSGWIEISITIEGHNYTKKLTWNKAKEGKDGTSGSDGSPGSPGTPAKMVSITPSNAYFIKKLVGSNYNITPNEITLLPDFQNCYYSKWEYSTNGSSFTSIARTATAKTLPYMNSSTRELTIPKAWRIITNNDYVVFKVTSTTGETDVQTISVLYDVGQLETRVNTAEQKITPTSITNTVETTTTKLATKTGVAQDIAYAKSSIEQTATDLVMEFASKPLLDFQYVKVSLKRSEESQYCYWNSIEVYANGENVIRSNMSVTADFTPSSGTLSAFVNGRKTRGLQYNFGRTSIWREVTVNMGSVVSNVDSIIYYNNSSDRHYYEKIEVSKDGYTWHTVYNSDVQGTYKSNYASGNVFHISGSASSGITRVSQDGIRVTHTGLGGQYSEMRADGFVRKWRYGDAKYLNGLWAKEYSFNIESASNSIPNDVKVELPVEFRGRDADIEIILVPTAQNFVNASPIGVLSNDMFRFYSVSHRSKPILKIKSKYLTAAIPYVNVASYMDTELMWYDGTNVKRYYESSFLVLVVGK